MTTNRADDAHGKPSGDDLIEIAANEDNNERLVFSEYQAAGAVSGAFMIRRGTWKYIYYANFQPELIDLEADPEDLVNVSCVPGNNEIIGSLHREMLAICDPVAVDQCAHDDQAALIASFGGREKALELGVSGATPPPE